MDIIGLDLHKRESQLCILTADGELVEQCIVRAAPGSRATPQRSLARGLGPP
jgi:hypothetical protein